MLIEETKSLAEHLPKQGVSAASLPPAIRRYVVTNLTGVRCADNVRRAERVKSRQGAEEVVRQFNESRLRRPPYAEREVPPITDKEAEPEKIGGAPPQQDYSLLELAPEGLLRETVLPAAVACLVQSPLQQRSPVLWFVSGNFIANRMRRSRLTAAGSEGAPKRDGRWALREFERSGSVILALAAKLDPLRPGQPR